LSHALFISDLHLPAATSPLREAFTEFLSGPARKAEAVYLLGDLFEYWIGDDAGLAEYSSERAVLHTLTASGVPVFFIHGNRDFLVGKDFARATGVTILPDPYRLDLHGVPTLLSHGDLFCTDDVRYQRWRKFARNAMTQGVFRRLPLETRQRILGGVRKTADSDKMQKDLGIMDVNEAAIRAAFQQHGVTRIIHGHTHRPADHAYEIDGKERQRHVLADWHPGRCEALSVDASDVRRVKLAG